MNTVKNIFFICILTFSFTALNAQRADSLDVKFQNLKKVILSSGETSIVVNKLSEGLNSKDADFLFKDSRFSNEQLFPELETQYKSLEEAAYSVNRLLESIEEEDTADMKGNSALGYRAAQVERMRGKKAKEVQSMADSLLIAGDTKKASELFEKFGTQPTYYLNGLQIDYSFISYLFPEEILSREVKVANTKSGNPNGEIWYAVPNKVLVEVGLIKFDASGTPYIVGDEKDVQGAKDALEFIKIGKKK